MNQDIIFDTILKHLSKEHQAVAGELHNFFPELDDDQFERVIDDLVEIGYIEITKDLGFFYEFEIAITAHGRQFYNQGGFQGKTKTAQQQTKKLEHDLRNAKYSLPLSIIALVISLLAFLISLFGNPFK